MEKLMIDNRWEVAFCGNRKRAVDFAVEHFLAVADDSIRKFGAFNVALSGGTTPLEVYGKLAAAENRRKIDWSRVALFWSDERAVPPDHPESNYRAAMEAGLSLLPIPPEQIFPMKAEKNIAKNAAAYEKTIIVNVNEGAFDLVLLGMGADGHTASLFPQTPAFNVRNKLVTANFVPEIESWRMTLTIECLNRAQKIDIYLFGETKRKMFRKIMTDSALRAKLPVGMIGTPQNKTLWITDYNSLDKRDR